MKSTAEMGAFVWDRIDQIHDRPLMYGGTAEGVDLILHYYHEIIAVIHDLEDEYQEISTITHQQEGCGSANFAVHYRRDRPDALDEETVRYVVDRWKIINERLRALVSQPE